MPDQETIKKPSHQAELTPNTILERERHGDLGGNEN